MSTVYFLGDLHLGHKNIANFRQQFSNEEEHYEFMKEAWHKRVSKHDKIYILGDCAFTLPRLEDFSKWRGTKVLVMGNHCYPAKGITLLDLNRVFDGRVYSLYKHKGYWLSHVPIHPEELRGKVNIHGHTHFHIINQTGYVNVCPENTLQGMPVSMDEVDSFVKTGSSNVFKYQYKVG